MSDHQKVTAPVALAAPAADSVPTAHSDRHADSDKHANIVLAIACVAQLMVVLDVSIVNVALPSIRRALHYSPTGLQWVVNAYTLAFAGFLMLGGRAGDLVGRRRIFLGGLSLFILASLLGGFAQDAAWLTAARALQGLGGAVLAPATLSIITTTFAEGEARTRALGLWSAVSGAGGAVGVLAGGVLTSELSWRWVLFVNVPIGAGTLIAGRRYLPSSAANRSTRLDLPGAVTITVGLTLAVYAIVETSTYSWGSLRTLGILAAALVVLGAFVVIERRSAAPLIPFSLFRSRTVMGANLTMLTVGAAFFSFWYFSSLYMQDALGYSALRTGLAYAPMGLAIIIGAQTGSRLARPVGIRATVAAGLTATFAGLAWMSLITEHTTYLSGILGPGLLVSVGLGLLLAPLAAAATNGVPGHQAGLASGLLNTSRQVGGSLGLAILATLATSRTKELSGRHLAPHVAAALSAGFARAFLVGACVAAAALAGTFLLPTRRRATEPVGAADAH